MKASNAPEAQRFLKPIFDTRIVVFLGQTRRIQ
jgi:hypothetical protein